MTSTAVRAKGLRTQPTMNPEVSARLKKAKCWVCSESNWEFEIKSVHQATPTDPIERRVKVWCMDCPTTYEVTLTF